MRGYRHKGLVNWKQLMGRVDPDGARRRWSLGVVHRLLVHGVGGDPQSRRAPPPPTREQWSALAPAIQSVRHLVFLQDFEGDVADYTLPARLESIEWEVQSNFDEDVTTWRLPCTDTLQAFRFRAPTYHASVGPSAMKQLMLPLLHHLRVDCTALRVLELPGQWNDLLVEPPDDGTKMSDAVTHQRWWPPYLTELHLGGFNQPVERLHPLPSELATLTFGNAFNQSVRGLQLPGQLLHLRIGISGRSEFQQSLDGLSFPPILTRLYVTSTHDTGVQCLSLPMSMRAVVLGEVVLEFEEPPAASVNIDTRSISAGRTIRLPGVWHKPSANSGELPPSGLVSPVSEGLVHFRAGMFSRWSQQHLEAPDILLDGESLLRHDNWLLDYGLQSGWQSGLLADVVWPQSLRTIRLAITPQQNPNMAGVCWPAGLELLHIGFARRHPNLRDYDATNWFEGAQWPRTLRTLWLGFVPIGVLAHWQPPASLTALHLTLQLRLGGSHPLTQIRWPTRLVVLSIRGYHQQLTAVSAWPATLTQLRLDRFRYPPQIAWPSGLTHLCLSFQQPGGEWSLPRRLQRLHLSHPPDQQSLPTGGIPASVRCLYYTPTAEHAATDRFILPASIQVWHVGLGAIPGLLKRASLQLPLGLREVYLSTHPHGYITGTLLELNAADGDEVLLAVERFRQLVWQQLPDCRIQFQRCTWCWDANA